MFNLNWTRMPVLVVMTPNQTIDNYIMISFYLVNLRRFAVHLTYSCSIFPVLLQYKHNLIITQNLLLSGGCLSDAPRKRDCADVVWGSSSCIKVYPKYRHKLTCRPFAVVNMNHLFWMKSLKYFVLFVWITQNAKKFNLPVICLLGWFGLIIKNRSFGFCLCGSRWRDLLRIM